MRFTFDPNSITMAEGDSHLLLYTYGDGGGVNRIEFAYFDDSYQVRAGSQDDSYSEYYTGWVALADDPHEIEIEHQPASAPEANDGTLTFWVDEVEEDEITGLDNDSLTVLYLRFGPSGVQETTYGTVYFDDFRASPEALTSSRDANDSLQSIWKPFQQLGLTLGSVFEHIWADLSGQAAAKSFYAPADVVGEAEMRASSTVVTTIAYTYDPLSRLTQADYSDGRYFHYTYDAVGNRLTESSEEDYVTYQYDIANRLMSTGGVSYAWDDNGNLLDDGVYAYSYDSANRLAAVTDGSTSVEYAYNGQGDRLNEVVNSQSITYTLDLASGLTQVLSDGENVYLYGYGRIAQDTLNGMEYYLTDALGSVRQVVHEDAVILNRSYEPYGEVLDSYGDGETGFGFTGEQQDSYINLYWYNSRWYDPSIMRWISPDAIIPGVGEGGNPDAVGCLGASNYSSLTVGYHENQLLEQLNLENRSRLQDPNFKLPPVPNNAIAFDRYAYSLNNPVRYTDPTGHCPFCIALAAITPIGWVAIGVTTAAVVVYFAVPGVREAVTDGIYQAGLSASEGLQTLFARGEYVPPGLSDAERIAYREAVHIYKDAYAIPANVNVPKEILDAMADLIKKGVKPIDAADSVDEPPEVDFDDE